MSKNKYKQEVKDVHRLMENLKQKGVKFKVKQGRLKYKDGLKVITGDERRAIKKHKEVIKALLFGCSHCIACGQWDWGDYKGKTLCFGVSWFFGRSKKPEPINECKCPLIECIEDTQ